jgi:hypothetical protein
MSSPAQMGGKALKQMALVYAKGKQITQLPFQS